MRKNILYYTSIAIIILFGACSNESLFNEVEKAETNPETGVKISLTATMPTKPNTRVGLDREDNDMIALTWKDGDQLQLVFVQGEIKVKKTVTVKDISEDRIKAQFEIVLPTGISEGDFTLYGLHGGGGLSVDGDKVLALLPDNSGSGSLASVETSNDVILYFISTIDATNPQASVIFQHLGSLFSITVKNTGADLSGIAGSEVRLIAADGTTTGWAYNNATGAGSYDLVSGDFLNTASAGDYLSFKVLENTITSGASITLWGWYPPSLLGADWPALKLEMRNASNAIVASSNNVVSKDAKNTEAGKGYYFFAELNGATIEFAGDTPPLGPNEYHVATMGDLDGMLIQAQRDTITSMIITGEINNADFNVLSQEIPNLTYLDLKDVTCENNEIPAYAFGERINGDPANTVLSTIIFPESLTSIRSRAFWKCTGLTMENLTFPDAITVIEANVFRDCSGLKGSVTFPPNLEVIQGIFENCPGLTGTLTFGDKITEIRNDAFLSNVFTGTVIFPASLKKIGSKAFHNATKVTLFRFLSTTPIVYNDRQLRVNIPIEVPNSALAAYQAALGFSDPTKGHVITGF